MAYCKCLRYSPDSKNGMGIPVDPSHNHDRYWKRGMWFFFSESKESLRILYSRVLHKGITNKSIMMVLPLKKSMCIKDVSICISINGYSKDIAWYGHSIQCTSSVFSWVIEAIKTKSQLQLSFHTDLASTRQIYLHKSLNAEISIVRW